MSLCELCYLRFPCLGSQRCLSKDVGVRTSQLGGHWRGRVGQTAPGHSEVCVCVCVCVCLRVCVCVAHSPLSSVNVTSEI